MNTIRPGILEILPSVMKMSHYYHLLAQSQNLFHVHQTSTVPHHCIQYEQNQDMHLADIAECDINGANLFFIITKALWHLISVPNINKIDP